ncbi:MAG: metal-sensing transcriptional repressor [Oscillospiraceae bacterium]|nr:metal-sensing transcriptional repressor [Oscillospiraceae bacterium]
MSEHTHVDENGNIIVHSHDHDHGHSHKHVHTQTKTVLNRLARAIGHLESVKRMVEEDRDCSEVLVQLAAVRSALNNTAKVILKDHIEHCIQDASSDSDPHAFDELCHAIDQFIGK